MYKNVGAKIQALAKFVCWLGIIGSIIIGALCAIAGYIELQGNTVNGVIFGVIFAIGGSIASWLSSLTLYAFGQIAEDIHAMREAK